MRKFLFKGEVTHLARRTLQRACSELDETPVIELKMNF